MRAFLVFLLLTTAASAAKPDCGRLSECKPHEEMAAALLHCAKEEPVRMGINKDNNLRETYASGIGTWTDVITNMITGESCITDFGKNHQGRLVPKPEHGA